MTRHSTRLLLAAALLSWSGAAHAQGTYIEPRAEDRTTRVGTRGANFLHIGVGAKAQGMGLAATASAEGPSALFWNPANIVGREGVQVFASHIRLYGNSGITHNSGAVTVPVGQGALGLGVVQFSSGEILRTTERAPQGDDPAFPGTFSWTGLAVSGHYARIITDRLNAAIGVRYVSEGIDFAQSSYLGADVSTRFRTGLYGLTLGAAVMNIGSTGQFRGSGVNRAITAPRDNGDATGRDIDVSYRTRDAQLPTSFRFGVLSSVYGGPESLFGVNDVHGIQAEMDFTKPIDGDLQTSVGLEYGWRNMLFARGGKRFFNEQHAPWSFSDGLAIGGGIRLPIMGRRIAFDYAYVNMGELQNNQVLSFEFGN